jgi:MFS family permease
MFLTSAALFAMWFFVSLYLQLVQGYSPLKTGFAFVPQTVAIMVGAQLSSRLVLRLGARPLLVAGGLMSSVGLVLFAGLGVHMAYWSGFFAPSVLVTLGLGLSFTPLAYAATAGVPRNEAGLASGLVNTSRQIGGAVGLAALATIATTKTHDVARAVGQLAALTDGYTLAFRISSAIALLAALAALLVPARQKDPASSPEPSPAASPAAAGASD